VVVVLAGCGDKYGDSAAAPAPPPPTTAARAAPDVSGKTLDGRTLSLASLRGKPVVVNVWSSW
jgi:hypothetical protein